MNQKHLIILNTLDELKFNIGKKTLLKILTGKLNKTIEKFHFDELSNYGSLYQTDPREIDKLIDEMIEKKMITIENITSKNGNYQILKKTTLGTKEQINPRYEIKEGKLYNNNNNREDYNYCEKKINKKKIRDKIKNENRINTYEQKEIKFTTKEKLLLNKLDFFIKRYNIEQKKAIISQSKYILCIAGAGTGKTTVLTKRIEFLVKFCGIKESEILAITFTRKAANEMKKRLQENGIIKPRIETFNSFCEKELRKNKKNKKILTFTDKLKIIEETIKELKINKDQYIEEYIKETGNKTDEPLDRYKILVRDLFSIIDFYKSHLSNIPMDKKENKIENNLIQKFYELEKNPRKRRLAETTYKILIKIIELKTKKELFDYNDQIIETLRLIKNNRIELQKFKHLLIDEFQDINELQFELIKELKTDNIFAVGDPRQSIYGWRGSNINLIYKFPETYDGTEIINLKKNYRNNNTILQFANETIKSMKLIDLEQTKKDINPINEKIKLIKFKKEKEEIQFVINRIKKILQKRKKIFLLARTNRTLQKYSEELKLLGIDFEIRTDETTNSNNSELINKQEKKLILATIHAIKGMEAETVFLVSANCYSFPNCVEDNFIFSLIKEKSEFYKKYNKNEEELRLFYVAITRAEKELYISYTKIRTPYITDNMLDYTTENLTYEKSNEILKKYSRFNNSEERILLNMLKDWRNQKSKQLDIPTTEILANQTLEQIIKKQPKNIEELIEIEGINLNKALKFGKEILKIIYKD